MSAPVAGCAAVAGRQAAWMGFAAGLLRGRHLWYDRRMWWQWQAWTALRAAAAAPAAGDPAASDAGGHTFVCVKWCASVCGCARMCAYVYEHPLMLLYIPPKCESSARVHALACTLVLKSTRRHFQGTHKYLHTHTHTHTHTTHRPPSAICCQIPVLTNTTFSLSLPNIFTHTYTHKHAHNTHSQLLAAKYLSAHKKNSTPSTFCCQIPSTHNPTLHTARFLVPNTCAHTQKNSTPSTFCCLPAVAALVAPLHRAKPLPMLLCAAPLAPPAPRRCHAPGKPTSPRRRTRPLRHSSHRRPPPPPRPHRAAGCCHPPTVEGTRSAGTEPAAAAVAPAAAQVWRVCGRGYGCVRLQSKGQDCGRHARNEHTRLWGGEGTPGCEAQAQGRSQQRCRVANSGTGRPTEAQGRSQALPTRVGVTVHRPSTCSRAQSPSVANGGRRSHSSAFRPQQGWRRGMQDCDSARRGEAAGCRGAAGAAKHSGIHSLSHSQARRHRQALRHSVMAKHSGTQSWSGT